MRLASNDGTYDAAVAAVHAECLVEIAHDNVDGGESAAQVSASGAELGAYDLNLTIRSAVSAARARLGEESASHFMSMVFRDYAVLLAVSSRQPSNWRGSGIKMSDSGDLGPLWISGLPGGITPEPPVRPWFGAQACRMRFRNASRYSIHTRTETNPRGTNLKNICPC